MAMPPRDETIEEIKRLDALLEYAVMHGDEAEAERLRAAFPHAAVEVLLLTPAFTTQGGPGCVAIQAVQL